MALSIGAVLQVINFDMPNNAEDYVHRIGRTGRAGAKGTSHSFFTAANGRLARDIIKVMREANQVVPPQLEQLAATSAGSAPSKWPDALIVNRLRLRRSGIAMCSCMIRLLVWENVSGQTLSCMVVLGACNDFDPCTCAKTSHN